MTTLIQELLAKQKALEAERDEIDKRAGPLYDELRARQKQMSSLQAEVRDLNAKIKAVERPRREEISRDLVAIAKATSKSVPVEQTK